MTSITFDREEAHLRGQIPLDKIKELVKGLSPESVTRIDFSCNGYCTDAVLRTIAQSAKAPFTNLTEVNLQGCTLLTDVGIKWLVDSMKGSKVSMVLLDGCMKLTENSLGLLVDIMSDTSTIMMRSTSMRYINAIPVTSLNAQASPIIGGSSGQSELKPRKQGHVIIVPHSSVKQSVSKFIKSKKEAKRELAHYETDVNIKDWNVSLTEMSLDNPLFDVMVRENPVQVVIPFDASAGLKEIQMHVMDTVSRVICKERVFAKFPVQTIAPALLETDKRLPFMDVNNLVNQIMTKDNLLMNFPKGEITGCYYSRQMLTRSNPYFEVQCVSLVSEAGKKIKVLIGCLYDLLFNSTDPMNKEVDLPAEVESFEAKSGDIYGFGLEGTWESEYCPSLDMKFYVTKNGERQTGAKLNKTNTKTNHYPLVSCVGEQGQAQIKFLQMNFPPENLVQTWEKENRTVEKGVTQDCLVDNDGIISFLGTGSNNFGTFLSQRNVIEDEHDTCTFRIEDLGEGKENSFAFGIVPHDFDFKSMPNTHSFFYKNDTEKVVHNSKVSDKLFSLDKGDEVTLCMKFTKDKPGSAKVEVHKNNKQMAELDYNYIYKKNDSHACVHFMAKISSKNAKVKIVNFRPHYRAPALIPHKITVGRIHIMKIMDDGTITSELPLSSKCMHGIFLAKTPLNSEMMNFDVKIFSLDASKAENEIWVGLGHSYVSMDDHLGSTVGAVAYSSSGKLFLNGEAIEKYKAEDIKFGVYDTVGCGVEVVKGTKSLLFNEDKSIKSQQKVVVYFTKNGQRVCETEMEHIWDGMYPCVTMSKPDLSARVLNFYPESTAVRRRLEEEALQKKTQKVEEKKKDIKQEKIMTPFTGCEFLVLGLGKDSSDVTGKLQQLQKLVNLKDNFPALTQITNYVQELEKNLGDLDLQKQENYSQLCGTLDNMAKLRKESSRIQYMPVDLTSGKGHDNILQQLEQTLEAHLNLQKARFDLPDETFEVMEKVSAQLKETKRIKAVPSEFGIENMCCDVFLEVIRHMQEQGRLVLADLGFSHVVLDVPYALKLITEIEKLSKNSMVNAESSVLAISKTSHIWTTENFNSAFNNLPDQWDLLKTFLKDCLGLLKIPCFRTTPDDPKFVFTTLSSLSTPPVSLREYWSKGEATQNFVIIQCTYSFPHSFPDHILSLILSHMTKCGRILLITPEGAAFQMGAVQTVIIRHEGHMEKGVISVESKCYFPKKMVDPVFKLTETNVKEYTWNIFCLYTDIVDSVLQQQNLVPLTSRKVPSGLVNVSVGCKHNWKAFDSEHIQSVCTLCGQCCAKGVDCPWNGIVGSHMRECGCNTSVFGCADCGICQSCAKEMWEVRSRLRPWPSMSNQTLQNISLIPMDPLAFDEIEFIHMQGKPPNLCLKEVYDGTLINVFPGEAVALMGDDENKLEEKLAKLAKNNLSDSYRYSSTVKDHITIRLSDPWNAVSAMNAEMKLSGGVHESRAVYYASIARELRVSQETGFVFYDSKSGTTPVAQLVGPKPFSKNFRRFSAKMISKGQKGKVTIGLCPKNYPPNKQPGRIRRSIAYRDDGGIFLDSNMARVSTKIQWEVGDIITCEFLAEKKKITFYKNDEQVFSTTLFSFSQDGCYPCIGMFSHGECLKLLEKEPWERTDEENIKPISFDTHRYGNLFISPAHTLSMKRKTTEMKGWVILHNPSKGKIGYKVTEVYDLQTDSVDHIGILTPGDSIPLPIVSKKGMKCPSEVTVKWMALEKSKDYSLDFITKQFESAHEDIISTHSINVTVQVSSVAKELTKIVNINRPPSNNVMVLEVLKNKSLVNRYWIKVGDYRLDIPNAKGDYLINHPKCPTYLYPTSIQKGLKVVVKISNELVEALVSELYDHGSYSLQYKLHGKQEKETLHFEHGTVGINDSDWEDDKRILIFKPDNNTSLLNKTYLPAPPYMITEGSEKALLSLDPDWKANALISFSQCSQVITRVTVQEQMITYQSRTLKDWLEGFGVNGSVDAAFTFLPSSLDMKTLTFPVASNMFDDIAVHRLCSFADQFLNFQATHNLNLRVPIHFVDIPAEIPTKPIPVNLTYGCLYIGWIYVALLAHKIALPSYSQIFKDNFENYTREQIESLLYYLIQPYASLCSVYAAQVGGLPNQENPVNGADKIEETLQNKGVGNVVKFKGKPSSATHELIEHGKMLSCKAHQLSISGNTSMYSKDLQMNYDYFEPYNELVNAFCWDLPLLPSLPGDFFSKFSNLQCFFLHRSELKDSKEIPSGISNCKGLETVILSDLGVSKLPEDLFQCSALKSVTCNGMPVKSLVITWPAESQLTKLVLSSLLITEVPNEIYKLRELTELNLDYNPITSLPDKLQLLSKLQILSIKGIPWVTFEGTRSHMTLDQYLKWHQENKCVRQNMPGEDLQEFFRKFDINKNSELDESEISHMNLDMFFNIPRFRNIKLDRYGGIPEVIFKMKSLKELYLNFQGITRVRSKLSYLQNLQVLSLSNCPLLESISGYVGLIPNINIIRLTSCPSLRTPPNEVVSRGFESIRAYLKRLAGGFTECRRTKLMFVGLGGAGKTSLLQALMSTSNKARTSQEEKLTDGIEIKPWAVKADNGLVITFSAWDFAGQTVYYNTHQFFLSNRAVYILLWNMRMGFEHAGLDFWLSSIACHAPETPILIVGTHSDQVPQVDIPEEDLKHRYPQISSFHYVSTIKGDGDEGTVNQNKMESVEIVDLKKQLIEVTLQQKYMGEKIPKVWLNLEKKILAERETSSILKWDTVKDFAMDEGIYDDKDVKLAVKFLDDLGTVQYFDNDFLRDRIVINPQWIVNVMACVVSVKQSPIQRNHGRFKHDDIKSIWKDYNKDLHTWLLRLTEEFDLTFPLPKDPINIVPCLLPQKMPKELSWPDFNPENGVRENKMVYKFAYLPAGLFNRAQVRLFQFSDGKLIWKTGSLLTKNRHLALIRQANDSELVVLVQGPRPENVLLLIHEVFESLIEESFHGVTYDFFIPCPDCITKEGTREPCLFKAELIRRAGELKAPFLQCSKYFHTVSMGQLLELMPEDNDTDFDIHLQHSISALQSINKAMSTDVAILYCKADLPGSNENDAVDPRSIIKDLEEAGLSCWFPKIEEGAKVEDIIVAIKNCKVVVAVMSDQFEKDMMCNNVFLYAMENLKKPFHIAVIGESMDWQKSDLGMKIGQPRMAMIKVQSRYRAKIKDLIQMTTETVNGINQGLTEHPVCFISYCWANSRQAVQLGTKAKPGSLGYGDPRDVKDFLNKKGIKCWIDYEQMGKYGLYHDIAVGLQNCKVILAFVSDEYVKSEACMMELRFGVCTMNLPLVVVVVGTGSEWKQSEVGLLMRRSSCGVAKVYMQKDNPEGMEIILQYVQNSLPKPGDKEFGQTVKNEKEKSKKSSTEDSQLSYREEYELIQRKFMRHISNMISKTDLQPLPKLIVFDFLKGETNEESNEPEPKADRPSKAKIFRRKSMSLIKMKPILDVDEDDWEEEELCIKVLCEHEEGWHLLESPLSLRTRTKEEIHNALALAAPFLARIYAILRQSSMRLNCINSKKGDNFQNWLEDKRDSQEKDGRVTATFLTAYIELIKFIQDDEDLEKFVSQLDRCHLPSGKISWLCPEHQKGNRITKLSTDEVSVGGGGKNTLFREDVLFKEYLEEHPEYREMMKAMKGETTSNSDKNTKTGINGNEKEKENSSKPTPKRASPPATPKPTSPPATPERTSPQPIPKPTSPPSTSKSTSSPPTPERTSPPPTPKRTPPPPSPKRSSPLPTPKHTSSPPTPKRTSKDNEKSKDVNSKENKEDKNGKEDGETEEISENKNKKRAKLVKEHGNSGEQNSNSSVCILL